MKVAEKKTLEANLEELFGWALENLPETESSLWSAERLVAMREELSGKPYGGYRNRLPFTLTVDLPMHGKGYLSLSHRELLCRLSSLHNITLGTLFRMIQVAFEKRKVDEVDLSVEWSGTTRKIRIRRYSNNGFELYMPKEI